MHFMDPAERSPDPRIEDCSNNKIPCAPCSGSGVANRDGKNESISKIIVAKNKKQEISGINNN